MNRLPLILSGFTGTAGRFGGAAGHILQDRLELLALELREAKIRFIQALILACTVVVFFLLGLLLVVLTCVYVLPPEWRIYGMAGAALVSLLAGWAAFIILRRLLVHSPLAFAQSLTELQKDITCFSTGI